MKTDKKVISFFLGSILLISVGCQTRPHKEEEKGDHHQEKPQERVEAPEQIISLEESKSLYDNYSKNRVELIQQYETERNTEEKFHAARFVSFDYDTIKQYMAYIEQEAKDAKVDISSLRFYFANYPDKKRFPDKKKIVHPRQNSIFMLPTMEVDGEDYGFYIGSDGEAKLVRDAVGPNGIGNTPGSNAKTKSYAGFVSSPSSPPALFVDKSLTINHGSSGPPPTSDY